MLTIAPAERPYECVGEKAEVIEDVDDVAKGPVIPLALKLALAIIGIVVRPVALTPVVFMERFVALALVPYLEDVGNVGVA